jgi:hypothetical protein
MIMMGVLEGNVRLREKGARGLLWGKVTGEDHYSNLIVFRLGALGALGFGSPLGM